MCDYFQNKDGPESVKTLQRLFYVVEQNALLVVFILNCCMINRRTLNSKKAIQSWPAWGDQHQEMGWQGKRGEIYPLKGEGKWAKNPGASAVSGETEERRSGSGATPPTVLTGRNAGWMLDNTTSQF